MGLYLKQMMERKSRSSWKSDLHCLGTGSGLGPSGGGSRRLVGQKWGPSSTGSSEMLGEAWAGAFCRFLKLDAF